MLNAAPVANDDAYTAAEDGVLSLGPLPGGASAVRWAENGHYYAHIPAEITWLDAEISAKNLTYLGSAGHLVTISSAEEAAFISAKVTNHLPGSSRMYIGLTDRDVEGIFRWVTGEPVTFTKWGPGEPNNSGGEDFTEMEPTGGLWNDIPGSINRGGYLVEFDGPFLDPVLDNDTDADNDPLIATLVTGPQHGTLVWNGGKFTYTPNANYIGPDSFTYKVSDGQAESNIAKVSIDVTSVNDVPVARPDAYSTPENKVLLIDAKQGLLANDFDQEGAVITAELVDGPGYGTVTINDDGSFAYTPTANYYGRDSFTYRASDGTDRSQPVTVSLSIVSDGQGELLAVNDRFTVDEDATLTITTDPLTMVSTVALPTMDLVYDAANDRILASVPGSGGTRSNTITPIDPYTGALGNSFFVGVDPRDIVVSADGRYIHAVIQDSRAIQIFDNTTQTLGPKINMPGSGEFTQKVRTITAIPGRPDSVLVSRYFTGFSPSAGGTQVFKNGVALPKHYGDGLGSGGPDITIVDTTGTRAFGYTPSLSNYVFEVLSINDQGVQLIRQYEGTFLSGNVGNLGYSRDRIFASNGQARSLTTNQVVGTFEGGDNYVIDEQRSRLFSLTRNGALQTIHIYDLDTLSKIDTLQLTGVAASLGSMTRFGPDGLAFRAEGDKVVIVQSDKISGTPRRGVFRNDTGPANPPLTASVVDNASHGTLTFNSNGTFTYVPQPNFHGADSFTYRISNGQSESNLAKVTIAVNSLNDAPAAKADSYSIAEDGVLTRAAPQGVLANDTDVENNLLSASVVTGPTNGKLTLSADGSFTYTPAANFSGTDTFTYRASDADPSEPATVTIVVTPVNDPPVAVNDTVSVSEDTPLNFGGSNLPAGMTPVHWSVNGHHYALVLGPINWHSAKAAAESLVFRGQRGHLVTMASLEENQFIITGAILPGGGDRQRLWIGLTDEGTEGNFRWVTGEPVTFTRWAGGQPNNGGGIEHYAEMVTASIMSAWQDNHATFEAAGYVVEFDTASSNSLGVLSNDLDADNDVLEAQLVSGPTNGTLALNSDGTFIYTPNPEFVGIDSFTYRASDGVAQSNVATVTLNVIEANDAPVAAPDSYFVADTLTVNAASGVLANDSDIDSAKSSLTAQLVTPPTGGTLTFNPDGSFIYVRGVGFTGNDTFTYRTSDGSASSAPATVTITAAVQLRTENVTIVSQPLAQVDGFFDVYLDVAPGFDFSVAGYDVALRTAPGSGVTLVSASAPSAAHPSLFATEPTFVVSGGTLRVTDALATGAAELDNGEGLFRVRFTVSPETVGDVPLLFTTAFTNLANENGDPLPISRIGGTITVNEPPAPQVSGVFVGSTEWSSEFVASLQTQGLGYAIPAGSGQLADLPWINLDEIVVRFNEHVAVQQADLVVRGSNNVTYATNGFTYDPASFTSTWTLEDPLPADKVLIQLVAGGADPIRNAAGVRLDGDWSDGADAFPSGDGRSGGDFLFRIDVLPGNTDQTGPVNIFDTIKTRNRQFTTIGDANYNPLYDVNGSGDINIFDAIQVRNNQFTSLPEGEPVVAAPPPPGDSSLNETVAAAPPAVRIRTDNVAIASQTDAAVEGVFDVFVDVMPGADVSIAGYDVALLIPPPGSGVTFVSAGMASAAHPPLFASEPTDFASSEMLGVTDALPTGVMPLTATAGLFSVRFTVAPGAVGSVPLMFHTTFTNLADGSGDPVATELAPGTITITPPPTVITGTSGDDQYHILRSGSLILIYENTPPVGQPTFTHEIATLGPGLTINTLGGNDSLVVDTGGEATLGLEQLIYNAGSGANTLTLKGGKARIDSTASGGTLDTIVQTGAQLSTSQLVQNGLTVENFSRVTLLPDGPTSLITSLALGAGGMLDIGDNALVIDYTGTSPVATVRERIISGRGGTGFGASWNGLGITSSAAAGANQNEPESHSVGYAENAALPLGPYATFRGVPVDNTAVLIAYTRSGDANLDGFVNDGDATVLGAAYAPAAANAAWALADFDYNGFVDDGDATLLGVFYNPSATASAMSQAPFREFRSMATDDGLGLHGRPLPLTASTKRHLSPIDAAAVEHLLADGDEAFLPKRKHNVAAVLN